MKEGILKYMYKKYVSNINKIRKEHFDISTDLITKKKEQEEIATVLDPVGGLRIAHHFNERT